MEKKDVAENARDAEVGPVHYNAKDRARDKEICGNKQIESVRLLPPFELFYINGRMDVPVKANVVTSYVHAPWFYSSTI